MFETAGIDKDKETETINRVTEKQKNILKSTYLEYGLLVMPEHDKNFNSTLLPPLVSNQSEVHILLKI